MGVIKPIKNNFDNHLVYYSSPMNINFWNGSFLAVNFLFLYLLI